MPNPFEYTLPQDDSDAKRLSQLLGQSFVVDPDAELSYMTRIGYQQMRIMRQGAALLGGLAILPMGQWFGGQRVTMSGIAAVCIAPEARGSGAALAMMQQTILELHKNRVPLSTLYPAVQQLYRRAGYEQGGTYCHWTVNPAAIAVKQLPLPLTPITLEPATLAPLAQQQARHHNGLLDRHPLIWQWVISPPDQRCYGYVIGPAQAPEGYLVFTQIRTESGTRLKILDWNALTPQAVTSLWAFLASHRSQIEQIQWIGGAIDWLSLGLPEQTAKLHSISRWMTRIVCVPEALEARGYPSSLTGELHLAITDDLLPENQGNWLLTLDQGQSHITQGGRGELKLSIRGLASLYTGLFSPHQLQQMGYLDGPEPSLSLAAQAFGGASPWLADFF
ncbi:MAG: GNAT family N-acetyltransferase [Cyanobacteria bacterium Co-bin8]|nr:GNAT family N-acetyltransferase [Cyanobacteria bacterium Co-bin8]